MLDYLRTVVLNYLLLRRVHNRLSPLRMVMLDYLLLRMVMIDYLLLRHVHDRSYHIKNCYDIFYCRVYNTTGRSRRSMRELRLLYFD